MARRAADAVDIEVGERIERYRLLAGLSRDELAASIGVTLQQILKYEKGRNRVAAGRLSRIAETLGIPVLKLYLGNRQKSKSVPNPITSLLRLLRNSDALRLLQAFSRVDDSKLRVSILQMVERTAIKSGHGPSKSPAMTPMERD